MSECTTVACVEDKLIAFQDDVNILWLLLGAFLVFLMQAGFSLLEVGSVSVRNTKNILIKNIFDAALGALCWWGLGYGFAMGKDSGGFIGSDGFWLKGDTFYPDTDEVTFVGSSYAMWMFQWAFAATGATIVSGAIAERVNFVAYIAYSVCITSIIYPVVVHWAWHADGWASAWNGDYAQQLFNTGVIDFAGSGVVHMTGGVCALVACTICGPRRGRFDSNGTPQDMPQQSPVFQQLGTLLLWFGWYGFNCASTLAISGLSGVAAKVAVTTTIGAATGGLTAVILGKYVSGIVDPGLANNGILAGLVAITASCSVVEPEGAFIIALVGAILYYASSGLLLRLGIDDVVDAVPVHMVNGAWGVIAAGLFATEDNYKAAYYDYGDNTPCGLFYSCNGNAGNQFAAQIVFVLAVFAWVGGLATALFLLIKATVGLRVSDEVEMMGMDAAKHGGVSHGEMNLKFSVDGVDVDPVALKEALDARKQSKRDLKKANSTKSAGSSPASSPVLSPTPAVTVVYEGEQAV